MCNVGVLFWAWLISSQWRGSAPLLSPAELTAVTNKLGSLPCVLPADSQETLPERKCGRPWICQAVLFCFVLFCLKGMLKFLTELLLKSLFKKPVLKYCEVVTEEMQTSFCPSKKCSPFTPGMKEREPDVIGRLK